MARKLNGIELTRYDDLFKTEEERSADRQERVQIVSAEQVFPYARQPYSVDRPSADLVRLMDSIERTGIAEPLIVRPRSEGGYEIISGHRRDYCAKVVGLDTRPVIVRDYSDEDADILVVDYNINRENLLPSEKAKAYSRTLTRLTGDYESWTGFLRSACYNYKCPFDEQVLIYAQRPNATAVLELEKWNRQFGRWVNAGATGIAVIDEARGKGRLKHYFDITDTHATRISRPVPIWPMEPAYTEPVIETLEATFCTLAEKDN